MSKVTDPLRRWVDNHRPDESGTWMVSELAVSQLLAVADAIEREHEVRMRSCQRETKRAFARYIRAITGEYERSRKRRRPKLAKHVIESKGAVGRCWCSACEESVNPTDKFCRHCGARLEGRQ